MSGWIWLGAEPWIDFSVLTVAFSSDLILEGSVVADAAMAWISLRSVSPACDACPQKPDPDPPLCDEALEAAEEAIDDAADDADPAAAFDDELEEDELPHAAPPSDSTTTAIAAAQPRIGENRFTMGRLYSSIRPLAR